MQNQEKENKTESSRVIKFRAWAFANKEMFYPNTDDGWEIRDGELYPLPNSILMQFTGLKDKNEKKIFEGDVMVYPMAEEEYTGKVIFDNTYLYYKFQYQTEDVNGKITTEELDFTETQGDEFEIIGNIYEHSHLLNDKDSDKIKK